MSNQPPVVVPALSEFEKALANVRQVAIETPVLHSHYLSKLVGQEVWLKCENLQRTGAYKVRGAFNRMSKLSKEEKKKGVIAASAGNHAQGVALAAKKLGIKATVYMPFGASLPKVAATRNYGAKVVLVGATFAEALKAAQEQAKETGEIFIPPFDHIDVVLGQGTVGLEIMDQHPDVKIRIIGVQAENVAPYPVSIKAGKITEVVATPTIADGIAVAKPGRVPFELIKQHIDKVVTVSENDIAQAILVLLERSKQVVEPAGAVAVAALMNGKAKAKGKTIAILSGGNMDPLLLQRVIRHGLSASDRYTNFSVMLPDRPGQLALTAEVIAGAHANVVEVLHTRHGNGLQISEVELNLSVETSGHEHRMEVVKALEKAGLRPRLEKPRED